MSRWRLFLAAASVLAGIAVFVQYWWQQDAPITGAGLFVAALALAVAILVGIRRSLNGGPAWGIGVVASVIGLVGLYTESRLMDQQMAGAEAELFMVFANLVGDGRASMPQDVKAQVEQALNVCGQQHYRDAQAFAVDAQAAITLGPGASLASGAYSAQQPKAKACIDYYVELRASLPNAFAQFERNHPWALERDSSG